VARLKLAIAALDRLTIAKIIASRLHSQVFPNCELSALLRNPIAGHIGYARAASGHAAAVTLTFGHGQMTPPPLGLAKQPIDCGNTFLGSHNTISGKKIINTIVIRKTT
jgi:hypothetical protein